MQSLSAIFRFRKHTWFKFKKLAHFGGKNTMLLFWKADTFSSERKPTVESLASESQYDSGVKAISAFLRWWEWLWGCFALHGYVKKQDVSFAHLESETVFAWAEPYVLHGSAADHHFSHLTTRHKHRAADTQTGQRSRPKSWNLKLINEVRFYWGTLKISQ